MGDQRVLRAIADLGPVGHVRHRAGLIGGFLEMLEIIQPDAIERARDQRQFDLYVFQRMRLRSALPFAERIAVDGHHVVALDNAPGRLAGSGEFEPTHEVSSCYSAAARGLVFQAPAAGRAKPRFSRNVLPA